jgi:hypothetical protein
MNFLFEDLENRLNFINCKDINASGISRFGISPLLNATHLYHGFQQQPMELQYHDMDDNVDRYVISACVNHSPDDWTGYNPRVKSLFSYLNEKYLTDLRRGHALLLLDQSFEGYQTNWLWEWFHDECKEWGVDPKYVVYVTGNMVADDVYKSWANENNIQSRMKVIPYAHFELDMAMTCYHRNTNGEKTPTFQDHLDFKTKHSDRIKTFTCLNKRLRNQRIWFFKYMHDAGILDKGLVSMNSFDCYHRMFEGEEMFEEECAKLNEDLPLLVYGLKNDELDDNYYINRFNNQQCLDTFVTVISEAHCGDSDETMFLSEKTFKVIACRHPFIIMGNKDSMKKLREIGYKTFEGFIDESYDSLPTHERMKAIIESIKKIDAIEDKVAWFKGMEEIIEHNYTIFQNKLKAVPDSYKVLRDYYYETLFGAKKIF